MSEIRGPRPTCHTSKASTLHGLHGWISDFQKQTNKKHHQFWAFGPACCPVVALLNGYTEIDQQDDFNILPLDKVWLKKWPNFGLQGAAASEHTNFHPMCQSSGCFIEMVLLWNILKDHGKLRSKSRTHSWIRVLVWKRRWTIDHNTLKIMHSKGDIDRKRKFIDTSEI